MAVAPLTPTEPWPGSSSAVPALSVIVRTVNRTGRLAECLASLAAQTQRDLEVVVVDMSGGAAATVLKDQPLRLVHLEIGGRPLNRAVALNRGIQRAAGGAIAVLDDDNCWEPAQAATLVAQLAASPADLVYTGVQRRTYTAAGEFLHEERIQTEFDFARMLWRNFIYTSACAFRKEAWARVGGFDPRFHVYEDWEFFIRLSRAGKVASGEEFGAISRKFTGVPGRSAHDAEIFTRAACLAALYWKHRALYRHTSPPEECRLDHGFRPAGLRRARLPFLLAWWWTQSLLTPR